MPPEIPVNPTFTFQGWIPVLGLVVALIAPLGPAIYNGWQARKAAREAAAQTKAVAAKLDATDTKVSKKLDEIHDNTNGRLLAALKKIDRLEQRLFESEGHPPTGGDSHPPAHPPVD